jgi:hypothetical protein
VVRDKLVDDIAALDSPEAALAWAIRRIGVKNSLSAEDAAIVERTFQGRVRVLAPEAYLETPPAESITAPDGAGPQIQLAISDPQSSGADSDVSLGETHKANKLGCRFEAANGLGVVKLRRSRDKDHLRFIATQPCTVCGRQPCEAHHIRYAQSRALGRRVSDEFTVPLCRVHHRELHRQGDERAWWSKFNTDPMPIALRFWLYTRGILGATTTREPQNLASGASHTMGREAPSSETLAPPDIENVDTTTR